MLDTDNTSVHIRHHNLLTLIPTNNVWQKPHRMPISKYCVSGWLAPPGKKKMPAIATWEMNMLKKELLDSATNLCVKFSLSLSFLFRSELIYLLVFCFFRTPELGNFQHDSVSLRTSRLISSNSRKLADTAIAYCADISDAYPKTFFSSNITHIIILLMKQFDLIAIGFR